ncbi:MAG: DUF2851 family protein [Candidatus Neomarinimicrobiota bacterium]
MKPRASPIKTATRSVSAPTTASPLSWPAPSPPARVGQGPGGGGRPVREVLLYPHWERAAGRTIFGPQGRYRLIHPGTRNGGPGPDYLDATLAFPDGTTRRGDIEIHLRRDGWRRHRHAGDPRYRRVLLHVVVAGALDPVAQHGEPPVPTALLPREPPFQLPCELTPAPLADFESQDEFLRLLAAQRWWRRLADAAERSPEGELQALAHRLGDRVPGAQLLRYWRHPLPGGGLPVFVQRALTVLSAGQAPRRPRGRLLGRAALLSALAYQVRRSPAPLAKWSRDDLLRLARRLADDGHPSASGPFLSEVAGNWLLPLASRQGGADRFEEWYRLPLGWSYGRVSQHVARLGLAHPASFGQQQGLLEWLESLCRPADCSACPVVGAAGEG